MRMPIHLYVEGGVVDFIDFEPYGTIRINGWHSTVPPCYLYTQQGTFNPTFVYRYCRQDVANVLGIDDLFKGIVIEFRRPGTTAQRLAFGELSVDVPPDVATLLNSNAPHYPSLMDNDWVLHRDEIYREGFPSDTVDPEILRFALPLRPNILDFGCGTGALVREFRARRVEAFGIELDRVPIREALHPDAIPFVRLYDGRFPLPYGDGEFESVIATEVIEHVRDYEAAISEIARVCRTTLAITVPDMACIPIGGSMGVVPWHLLESTHVNFFNNHSLTKVLKRHFQSITLFQLARREIDGRFMPGSLGAIASKW
jgi:SAM-dependent methyltransferase